MKRFRAFFLVMCVMLAVSAAQTAQIAGLRGRVRELNENISTAETGSLTGRGIRRGELRKLSGQRFEVIHKVDGASA